MSSPVCFYCKKWFINDILTTVGRTRVVSISNDMCEDMQFIMNGFVSLAGNASSQRPVKKFSDIGVAQIFMIVLSANYQQVYLKQ